MPFARQDKIKTLYSSCDGLKFLCDRRFALFGEKKNMPPLRLRQRGSLIQTHREQGRGKMVMTIIPYYTGNSLSSFVSETCILFAQVFFCWGSYTFYIYIYTFFVLCVGWFGCQ